MRRTSTPTIVAVITAMLALACTGTALAEDAPATSASSDTASVAVGNIDTSQLPAALKGDTEIEQLTNAYESARKEVEAAEAKVNELQSGIDELEALLPDQEARSNAGIKQRYIMQSNPLAIMEPLLTSQTLDDFVRQIDYLEKASRSNLREFNKTRDMRDQLRGMKEEQARVLEEATAHADEAHAALAVEQDKRAAAQREGQATSAEQAEKQGGEESVGKAADGGEQPKEYREAATQDTESLVDGADWHADRDAFIAEWAPRIDAYLAGSALDGQGVNFAASAWKHGIDPRWSPAISNTESSKGAVCIRPHNAWGWGAADSDPYNLALEWESWEEAIDAHVAGLAKGYGYTISMRGAMAYCPNTWQSWYNKTLAQMAMI